MAYFRTSVPTVSTIPRIIQLDPEANSFGVLLYDSGEGLEPRAGEAREATARVGAEGARSQRVRSTKRDPRE